MSSRQSGATKVQFDNACRCKHCQSTSNNACRCKHCQSTSNNTNSDRSHVALTRLVPCGLRLVCVCQWISKTIFETSHIRWLWPLRASTVGSLYSSWQHADICHSEPCVRTLWNDIQDISHTVDTTATQNVIVYRSISILFPFLLYLNRSSI